MTLLLLSLLVLGLVLWGRLNTLTGELRQLRERLEELEGGLLQAAGKARQDQVAAASGLATGAPETRAQDDLPPAVPLASESVLPGLEDQPGGAGDPTSVPLRQPVSSRTVFAVLGAGVTLAGAAWFTAALARSGVLTREVQLGLAALLAVGLYLGAGRAAPVIGEAMRGLGYGILALCIGALVGAGVAPAGVVLAAILALSLAVGLHGAAQGRLLGTATALAGASLSTWILADNLGHPLVPQLALLGIFVCTVLAERRLSQPGSALLALLPAVSLLGLVVTTVLHGQPGQPLLWAGLLLGALGAALAIGLRPDGPAGPEEPAGLGQQPLTVRPARPVLAAGGVLLAGLAGAVPLLQPLGGAGLLPGLSTTALLLVGAVCAGLAVRLHRRASRAGAQGERLLRDAVLGVGVGTLGGALALGLDGLRMSTRLLGLASATALLGTWMRSRVWRTLGAAAVALLLLDHLLWPWPSSVIVALLGLATGVALAGRAGAVLAAVAGATLVTAVTALTENRGLVPGMDLRFLAALSLVLALHGAALALDRRGRARAAPTVAWAAVAASLLLVPVALVLAATPAQAAAFSLLAGAVLFLAPGGRRAATLLRGSRFRMVPLLEGLGVAAVVLGLLVWTSASLGPGNSLPPLGLLLALLAALLVWLPGESRPFWRAWPVLGLAVLVSLGVMLGVPRSVLEGVLTLLGAAGTLAALWLLVTPAGLEVLEGLSNGRLQKATEQARQTVAPTFLQEGLLVALALTLLSLMGRSAQLLVQAGWSPDSTVTSTAVLLAGSVALLVWARWRGSPLRWWVGLAGFGVAALKLVFVDFGDLGGIARGAATVVIGLLLLGIGQLAPRPEARTVPAESGPGG